MAKKIVKVSKKKSGFLESNLGGSLSDIMNDDIEVVNETETVEGNNSDVETQVKGNDETKTDKDSKSLIEVISEDKDSKNEDCECEESKILQTNISKDIKSLIDKIKKSDKYELSDSEKENIKKELDTIYNNSKSELDKMHSMAYKDASVDRMFIALDKYDETLKDYFNVLNMYKDTSSNIKEFLSNNHDKLNSDAIFMLNTQLKHVNSMYTILDQYFNHKIKSLIADEHYGMEKVPMIINALKYIKAATKFDQKKLDEEESKDKEEHVVDLSKIELEPTYKEFTILYNNMKYNDCKAHVKKLANLLTFASHGDINMINNFFENYTSIFLDDLTDKQYVSKESLESALMKTNSMYINDIDNTLKFIDGKLSNKDLDKNLRVILDFTKSILKESISRLKSIVKELKHRDVLTIEGYIEALKSEPDCSDVTIPASTHIVSHIPKEVKCKLIIVDGLSLCGVTEDDIILKFSICNQILESILSDKHISHNIKVYPELIEQAQMFIDDNDNLSIEDVIKANKSQIINNIQNKIVLG